MLNEAALTLAPRELILGGQRSGKSRRAEMLARAWLAQSPNHQALLVATAREGDAEMQARIAQHRIDRAERVPGLQTVEEPMRLAAAIAQHNAPQTLLVVDCLTLWLINWLMPLHGEPAQPPLDALLDALTQTRSPIILVSNEIGLGVIPMGRETRDYVDALGRVNQAVAQVCERVTFMAAGLPMFLKNTEIQTGEGVR
jgi:adenosylcobinamide kinase/adenosylcobinamide-phosphate guanylyltransferase